MTFEDGAGRQTRIGLDVERTAGMREPDDVCDQRGADRSLSSSVRQMGREFSE
jgi:hypothetical protein